MSATTATAHPRFLAIGLDGATWTILRPLMEQGLLPHLQRLVSEGASGELLSTVPAHSGPAWTTFMTGVNPGKHGVFGFTTRLFNGKVGSRPTSSRDIQAPTIFQLLGEAGQVVGSVNLPMTYPPFPVNGFLISDDMLRPPRGGEFTYPTDVLARIGLDPASYNEGGVRTERHDGRDEALIEDSLRRIEIRVQVTLRLMASYDWRYLVVVFTETDRVQHLLWHVLDPAHPRYEEALVQRLRPRLLEVYRAADRAIGALAAQAGPSSVVTVVSDHGFGPQKAHLLVNHVLAQSGLLAFAPTPVLPWPYRVRGFLHRHVAPYRWLKRGRQMVNHNRQQRKPVKRYIGFNATQEVASRIDWSRSYIYSFTEASAGVHVNLKGREPHGVVEQGDHYDQVRRQAIAALSQVRDPQTGEVVPISWHPKEAFYHGPCTEHAPDILCVNESDYKPNSQIAENRQELYLPTVYTTGWHRAEGIVVLAGPGIRRGVVLAPSSIADLAPTTLHYLGCPVPAHMDGRVLEAALEPSWLATHPIQRGQAVIKAQTAAAAEVYSPEEMAKIEQRLGDLGYLE
ncbi:MAG: alkaline phosphatase family protein [Candidatus Omnitrophica bacterium]|nr:alkaline phosphatase family protein [Candidatus Omnitrophota bacterium]